MAFDERFGQAVERSTDFEGLGHLRWKQPFRLVGLAVPCIATDARVNCRCHMHGEGGRTGDLRVRGHGCVERVGERTLGQPRRLRPQDGEHRRRGHRHRPPGQVREHGEFRPLADPGQVVKHPLAAAQLAQRAWPRRAFAAACA